MNYKRYLILFFILFSCTPTTIEKKFPEKQSSKEPFFNKGFTLVYEENLKKNNKISKIIEDRSLIIFQRNLKKDTKVKITNLLNNKSILAKVGLNSEYPVFYNSVISKRIYNELEIDENEPYVEIMEVFESSTFIAKKAKTFDEEKVVANKAPVDGISINDISISKKKINKKKASNNFNYIIKVADFYYNNSAISMKKRIIDEVKLKNVKIIKISNNNFRVYLGPYNNMDSMKKAFNDMNILNFENLEIIKQ
tara:strand:- start:4504 stop:5259 length:756 start_codon:yes stop_codon:yes gene_type:complete